MSNTEKMNTENTQNTEKMNTKNTQNTEKMKSIKCSFCKYDECYCYKPGILRNYQDYRRTVLRNNEYTTTKEYRILQQKACGIEISLCCVCKNNSYIRWCNQAADFFCRDCIKIRIW